MQLKCAIFLRGLALGFPETGHRIRASAGPHAADKERPWYRKAAEHSLADIATRVALISNPL